ncbi:hypothetical protein G7Y89_g5229 [Cudoniella acicularis]|uniref:beta-glucosidase n=1 Tax=Cudoniella acicularis TaxID=354080 RepID=A0A8H4RPD7_9HELO|nr:hypothetical protein G7Y89_g5229 [Cudoniella acicularis]
MKISALPILALATPVFSSAGDGDWASAYTKAKSALAKMSQADKVAMVSGTGWQKGPCVGNTAAISSIKYPALCLQDGPLGVRYAQGVTAFPAGITTGSTWDKSLMYDRGYALGSEAKALGVHVQLGPVAGPLGKIPRTVEGMQSGGVQACAKHFIGNEQELKRDSQSANIDDRTNHELYLWPFAEAIKANVTSIMCSYNKFNTTWTCENKALLSGLLKDELDFQGFVVSDWGAQHTTVGSANAGLDMTMPGDNFSGGKGGPNVQGDHKNVARAIARDGIVLLKNEKGALPLVKPKSLAIIGYDAIVNPAGANGCVDRNCDNGTLAMGWGSGTAEFPYLIAPLDAIKAQATTDGTTITTSTSDNPSQGASAAEAAATAIVFINSDAGENYITVEGAPGDRLNLDPWHKGNDLVTAVANTNVPTIVVIHSVGPLILETILALPSVVAVVWAGIPGQETGNGLADILYGSTSPNGKLPYTIAKQVSDYGIDIKPAPGDDSYSEGLYIDYRRFDKEGIEPRYEFGFGLSYTTFAYSDLTVSAIAAGSGSSTKVPGGKSDLYDVIATISATITNNGTVKGAEVAQLYIGLPSSAPASPVRQLRGFSKVALEVGKSGVVSFPLRRKDLSFWDVKSESWVLPSGEFGVWVGSSSRDLRLSGKLEVEDSRALLASMENLDDLFRIETYNITIKKSVLKIQIFALLSHLSKASLSTKQLARLPFTNGPFIIREPVVQDSGSTFDVFCWQNGTTKNPSGTTFLRTTSNAYVDKTTT